MDKVGMPSVGGIKSSLVSYLVGAGGGLLYGISSAIFGSGLIGGVAGAAIAGSMVKGVKGEIIATQLGFQTGMQVVGGAGQTGESASQSPVI